MASSSAEGLGMEEIMKRQAQIKKVYNHMPTELEKSDEAARAKAHVKKKIAEHTHRQSLGGSPECTTIRQGQKSLRGNERSSFGRPRSRNSPSYAGSRGQTASKDPGSGSSKDRNKRGSVPFQLESELDEQTSEKQFVADGDIQMISSTESKSISNDGVLTENGRNTRMTVGSDNAYKDDNCLPYTVEETSAFTPNAMENDEDAVRAVDSEPVENFENEKQSPLVQQVSVGISEDGVLTDNNIGTHMTVVSDNAYKDDYCLSYTVEETSAFTPNAMENDEVAVQAVDSEPVDSFENEKQSRLVQQTNPLQASDHSKDKPREDKNSDSECGNEHRKGRRGQQKSDDNLSMEDIGLKDFVLSQNTQKGNHTLIEKHAKFIHGDREKQSPVNVGELGQQIVCRQVTSKGISNDGVLTENGRNTHMTEASDDAYKDANFIPYTVEETSACTPNVIENGEVAVIAMDSEPVESFETEKQSPLVQQATPLQVSDHSKDKPREDKNSDSACGNEQSKTRSMSRSSNQHSALVTGRELSKCSKGKGKSAVHTHENMQVYSDPGSLQTGNHTIHINEAVDGRCRVTNPATPALSLGPQGPTSCASSHPDSPMSMEVKECHFNGKMKVSRKAASKKKKSYTADGSLDIQKKNCLWFKGYLEVASLWV